jgi:hypothetical protein
MWGWWLSRRITLMHPTLMTVLANERTYDLRADAAARRRSRFVISRGRRAQARRLRRQVRVAHA